MKLHLKLVIYLYFLISPNVNGVEISDMKKYTLDETHLVFAKKIHGETWELLEKEQLSNEEKSLLLYSAFASSYHWHHAGDLVNKQRGEWLIYRAYVKLRDGTSALIHAKNCLAITKKDGVALKDFDYAYAYEAMARSNALLGNTLNASQYYKEALLASHNIKGLEDRKLFLSDLKGGYWNQFSATNESH